MTIEEYFNQTQYFSESAQEFVDIDRMVFSHAFYAMRKLHSEYHEEFVDTPLFKAFMAYLYPSMSELRRLLRTHGSVSHVHWGNTTPVRSRLYHAAKREGLKVTTHKEKDWVTAKVISSPVHIRVKGRVLS